MGQLMSCTSDSRNSNSNSNKNNRHNSNSSNNSKNHNSNSNNSNSNSNDNNSDSRRKDSISAIYSFPEQAAVLSLPSQNLSRPSEMSAFDEHCGTP